MEPDPETRRNAGVSQLSRRKTPTQQRARSTVESIFAATAHLVRAHGFSNVGTRMIAKRAGISVGSLYQYFPSYEAILLAWYHEVASDASKQVEEITLDVINEPFLKAARASIGTLLTILEKHALVLLRMPAEVPQIEQVTRSSSFMLRNHSAMRIFFARHTEFDPSETEHHIFFLETMIMSVLRRWVTERPRGVSRAQVLDQLCALVDAYLRRNVVASTERSALAAR